jgi:hypothetical protein
MTSGINSMISVPESDLTTPTLAAAYPVGSTVRISNGLGYPDSVFVYIKAAGALTAYQPYVFDLGIYGATNSSPVTLGAPGAIVIVPQVAFTSGYYGWVLMKGYGKVLHIQETYVAGDMLQLLSGGAALVVDGSSNSTIKSVNTCGITVGAGTTAVAKTVVLNGEQAVVAAT